jgi:hypothetical protein
MHIKNVKRKYFTTFFILGCLAVTSCFSQSVRTKSPSQVINKIPITVENNRAGSPLNFGIPFQKGALYSPDNVRVVDANGKVVPSQITEVNTWQPANSSIQWIWAFFFSNGSNKYFIEYGPGIRRETIRSDKIIVSNHWVDGGKIKVNTGKIKFYLRKGIGGFINDVQLNLINDDFSDTSKIVGNLEDGRGAFVDILDDKGLDLSKAEITGVREDKGSGPMHVILHVDGIYHYEHNTEAPFVMHIHVYAGQSYMKVLNTMIYTGVPTKHPLLKGQHALIATTLNTIIINEDSLALAKDKRWIEPNDQIAEMGLNLKYNLTGPVRFATSYREGKWWEDGTQKYYETTLNNGQDASIFQTGLDPIRMPPLPHSSGTSRIGGFNASVKIDGKIEAKSEKSDGWIDITDKKWGIAVGIRNFFKEFPKEIDLDNPNNMLHLYAWTPNAGPMSFARHNDDQKDEGMFDNLAQGLAKTTENIIYFHGASESLKNTEVVLNYFLDPSVPHTEPHWYTDSKVWGDIAPANNSFQDLERGLKYKYQWMLYNQNWQPWYGMWDYGELKNYYFDGNWYEWSGNEPAQDFMWWLEFIRTGDRNAFIQAQAMSRITMDVDQIHWPKTQEYDGGTNPAIDYWENLKLPKGSPYVGMGRRHGEQHWVAALSAHVWVPGWIMDYFLTGENRGLEVAKETGDLYLRRIWGDHGTTGRRLYLSVWNLDWIYNATKEPEYGKELEFRVSKMLKFQKDQQGNLVMDRYDYSQSYASHGLDQYLNFTGKNADEVKAAIVENARRLRDAPPWGHEYESYLATIHPVLLGYKYTGNKSFLEEAIHRSQFLKMSQLPKEIKDYKNLDELEAALEKASNLPKKTEPYEMRGEKDPIWKYSSGMRVFGWTHIYNVPWLLYGLEKEKSGSGK